MRGLAVAGLVAALLVLVPAQTAIAAPTVNLAKDGDSTVLVGGDAHFTLTSTNPGDTDQYNATFRDELPVGVTYKPSSTSPAKVGEPTIVVDPIDQHQTLIWRNTADLPVGGTQALRFAVEVDPAVFPVGSTFVNVADLYTNADPRLVARFDTNGNVLPGSYSSADTSNPHQVTVTALEIEKSEGSPEHELLRGIHDQTSVYTLTVTNNDSTSTTGITVVDYLPAQLEFLGCGGVDNGALEYPGAPSLIATPAVAPCVTPDTVETVSNPAGHPAGVYTKVTWTLPNLAGGATSTVKYRAGIPQRANTTAFAGGTPTPGSRLQTANLDNNTGADTREGLTERSLTNTATVSGTYGGITTNGVALVSDTASQTVTVEDLSMQKTADTDSFSSGDIVTYTLTVRGSEYVDGSGVVVTDRLPNGLCPLSTTTSYDPSAGCGAAPGQNPGGSAGASYDDVVANADGTFDITFTPIAVAHNQVRTITFQARMKAAYVGGDPTVSGDDFVNTTALNGTTSTRPTNPPSTGDAAVEDDSSHTLTSDGPSLDKTIKANTTPYSCASGGYDDPPSATDPSVVFSEGSRVCFRIRVDFPAASQTRNPVLSDFLPDGVVYEPGSATISTGAGSVGGAADLTNLIWKIGNVQGANRYAPPGSYFEVTLSGIVTEPAAGPAPDVTGNLAKLRWTDTAGQVSALRDQVPFAIAPVPPVTIVKAASRVVGSPGYPTGTLTDGATVVAGNKLKYSVTVANDGNAADHSDRDVVGPDVWDVLPVGITCAAISAISDAGACTDPGSPGHPSFTGNATASALRWNLPDTVVIAPGGSKALTYDLVVPASVSVGTTYKNVTAVASYGAPTNLATIAQHHPAANIDTGVTAGQVDAPAARDDFTVVTPRTGLSKVNATSVNETGNTLAGQATIGEVVTYTVQVTVPARTTIYGGVLTDPAPTGVVYLDTPVAVSFSDGAGGTALPAGTSPSQTSALATLTLPATYANTTDLPHTFTLVVQGRISTLAANAHGIVRTNTAVLSSKSSPTGTAVPPVSATSAATVVEPSPTLAKTDDVPGTVAGGQTLTFTLKAGNAAGRPPLHDAFVVDCVPAMLTFGSFVTIPAGTSATTAPGGSGNSCAAGTTAITWNTGDLLGGAANDKSLVYSTTVATTAAAGVSFTNTAVLAGTSLDDNDALPGQVGSTERAYSITKSDTNTVTAAGLTKTTSTPVRTIGQLAQYAVTVTLPRDVTLYDTLVHDRLPAGLDPATLTTTSVVCAPACSLTATPVTATAGPSGSRNVGWTLGDVTPAPVARTVTITYTAKVADIGANVAGTTLVNAAKLLWNLADGANPTTANDTGFGRTTSVANTTVTLTEPALTLVKTVDDTTPEPGQTIHYTVTVANPAGASKSAAHNIVIKDVVPVGLTGIVSISNGGTYDAGTRTITWTLTGPLNPGGSVPLTYDAKLASPPPAGALRNTVTIAGYDGLPSDGRHYTGPSAQATVTAALPHVRIAKTVIAGPTAYIGQSKTWQIVVTSDGNAPAYGIDVKDVLPPSWTYDAGSAQVSVAGAPNQQVNPVISGQTLTWTDLGDLPSKTQTVVVVFTATPGPGVVTTPGVGTTVDHTNTASTTVEDVEGSQQDADGHPYNGGPSTAVARIASADVRMAKTHSAPPVAGQPFSWTLTASNAGPDTAAGPFVVSDTLPAALAGAGVVAGGPGWKCSVTPGPSSISCTRTSAADTLANGSAFPVITVTAQLPADLAGDTALLNTASVTAQTYDPITSNNTDDDSANVETLADLSVVKSLSSTMVAGFNATYQLSVSNAGPSVHRGLITVQDAVPAGTTFVDVSAGAGWTCGEASGDVTCTRSDDRPIGTMPPITVTVHVDADRTAAVVNTATVTGTTPDPDPGNNTDTVTTTPDTWADLEIAKHSEGNSVANPWANGEDHSYLLTVTNHGPSVAQGPVKITDTLPTGMTYLGFESVDGTWSCTSAALVTCTLTGDLDPDETVKVRVQIRIAPDASGPYENTAHVTSSTPDPDLDNNTDTDETDSVDRTDFSLAKSHPAGAVHAGESLTFSLVATNHGPSQATDPTTITDILPAGMTFVSSSGAGWSCDPAPGNTVVCVSDTDVDPGDDLPSLSLTVKIAADAGPATLTNLATVDSPTDKNPDNNSDTDTVTVTDRAEIVIVKTTTGANPVDAGGSTSYSVKVTNDGPSDADDLVVVENPPPGLQITGLSGSGWSCVTATLVCTRPTLEAGDSASITVTATVTSGTPDGSTLTNVATVSTTTPLSPGSDLEDDADVVVNTAADLSLVKTHPTGTAIAGLVTSYTIAVHNNGPSDAVGPILITDDLPADFTFVSADNGWECDASAAPQILCSIDGPLLAGADAPLLTMNVQVAGNANLGTHTNEAEVSSQTPDPVPGNNDDDADVEVGRLADVSVVKSHTDAASIGGQVAFTLQARNDGPSSARQVVVTDDLPAGLTFVSADGGPDWTCTEAAGTVTCEHDGPLAGDTDAAPITVVVEVGAAAYPSVENTAVISTATLDDNPANDTSTDELPVPPIADLSIVKKAVGTFVVGKQGHYDLRVRNAGPTEAPGIVTVSDVLPAGLAFVSGTGPGWSCSASGQKVTCTKTGLPNGADEVIDLVVDVLPASYPSVTNTATVGSEATDPETDDNTSTTTTPATPTVVLQLVKTVKEQVGKRVTWHLAVTNLGPSGTVAPVAVTDLLVPTLTYIRAAGAGFTCGNVGQLVTCSYAGVVRAGDTVAVDLVTVVDAAPGEQVTNTASVTGGIVVDPPTDEDSETVKAPRPDGGGNGLPDTGGPQLFLVPVGVLLLLVGGATVLLGRRRSY